MIQSEDEPTLRVELDLDDKTLKHIEQIVRLIGFPSVDVFLRTAIKKQVDYYSVLLRLGGTGEG